MDIAKALPEIKNIRKQLTDIIFENINGTNLDKIKKLDEVNKNFKILADEIDEKEIKDVSSDINEAIKNKMLEHIYKPVLKLENLIEHQEEKISI